MTVNVTRQATPSPEDWSKLEGLQTATRRHRVGHGCGAYTFEDGPGLARIVGAAAPRRIIELGTALGYTAAVMAMTCPEAKVHTVEGDPSHVVLARKDLAMLGLAQRITVHEGDFADVLSKLAGPFDLAFFDGFAPEPQLVDRLCGLVSAGGWVICANLGLAGNLGRRDLERLFAGRWIQVDEIENGGTAVFRSTSGLAV